MKIGFTLKDVKVMDKATIGEISINVQYDAKELVEEYGLVRKIIRELPEVAGDLGAGFLAVNEMDKAFDGLADARHAEENVEEAKQSAINKVMAVVNSLRGIVPSSTNVVEEKEAV